MLPFEMAAFGIGFDEKRQFTAFVIVHNSTASAETHAKTLVKRFDAVKPLYTDSLYDLDELELHISDRFLIARPYFENPPPFWV